MGAGAWLLGISWAWGHERHGMNCHSRWFAELAFFLSDRGSVCICFVDLYLQSEGGQTVEGSLVGMTVFTYTWAEPEWDLVQLASFIQVFGKLQTAGLEFSLPGYIKRGRRDIFKIAE